MTTNTYGLKSLFILIIIFIVTMILAFLSGCLCAAILVYFKNGSFIFGWHEDVLFSIKRGFVVGIPTGVGIWILSRMKQKEEPSSKQ